VTAARFLELFRGMGGDAFISARGEVVLDAPASLLEAVRWRIDAIGRDALAEALEEERALAEMRLRARGITPRRAVVDVVPRSPARSGAAFRVTLGEALA
jgi:hypothetical protein